MLRLIGVFLVSVLAAPGASGLIVEAEAPAGRAHDVEIVGHLAYVADQSEGLRIFDVSRPADPAQLGSLPFPDLRPTGIALGAELVFLYGPSAGVAIVDASNPAAPIELARFARGEPIVDVSVADGVAYVSMRSASDPRVEAFDVRDPTTPAFLYSIPVAPPTRLEVVPPLVFSCGYVLQVIDVSDPDAPVLLSTKGFQSLCTDIQVADGRVHLGNGQGLWILDVSNPAAPVELSLLPGRAVGLRVRDTAIFVLETEALRTVDAADPTAPEVVGTLGLVGLDVAIGASIACVAAGDRGLLVVDVSSPTASPVDVGRVYTGGRASDVVRRGNRVYTVDGTSLHVIDVSDFAAPHLLGYRGAGSGNTDLDLQGSLAAVSSNGGLGFLDVTNESLPDPLGWYVPTPSTSARGVEIQGSLAYLLTFAGLEILDIADPQAPAPRSLLPLPSEPTGIVVDGPLAYIAGAGPSSLHVVDVRTPSHPVILSTLALWGVPRALAVSRGRAYVAALKGGLQIVDVADPAAPRLLGGLPARWGGISVDVAVSGRLAYVADQEYGARVVDVSRPERPLELARVQASAGFHSPGSVLAIDARHGVAFVGDSSYVRIVDFRPMLSAGIRLEMTAHPIGAALGRSLGLLRVVLFGSAEFDAGAVDRRDLVVGDGQAPPLGRPHAHDVDGDRERDLVAHFLVAREELADELCVSGRVRSRRVFEVCGVPESR